MTQKQKELFCKYLGKQLRYHRRAQGFSVAYLQNLLGVSANMINSFERGESKGNAMLIAGYSLLGIDIERCIDRAKRKAGVYSHDN